MANSRYFLSNILCLRFINSSFIILEKYVDLDNILNMYKTTERMMRLLFIVLIVTLYIVGGYSWWLL